jgi:molybdate transport system regulatory protein
MLELKGMLSLQSGDRTLGGLDRIELLEKIGETGSISAAARAVGMSYKGAWDAVDAMNNLSDEPLVVRSAGGKHGGGTGLTSRARRLIEVFRALEVEHQHFVRQLGALGEASVNDIELMRRFMIRTSARNQLSGKVVAVHKGAVNDTIELEIHGGQRIVASITSESTANLGLVPGKEAVALIKASSVLIGIPDGGMRLSARNQLPGKVSDVTEGAVNSEVTIQLDGGGVMVAIVTSDSVEALELAEGVKVVAIIKASNIILGTLG